MPTYEYQCTKCGFKFDLFQRVDSSPREKCPRCNGKVRKLISGGCGIIFKGSGFYETDYKRKSPPRNKIKEKAVGNIAEKNPAPKK